MACHSSVSVDLAARAMEMAAMSAVAKSMVVAVGEFSDGAILKVLAKSLTITIIVLVVFGFSLAESLPRLLSYYLEAEGDTYVVLSWVISVAAVWFLFRIVALAVMQPRLLAASSTFCFGGNCRADDCFVCKFTCPRNRRRVRNPFGATF